jgi:hypothetical protein
MQIDITFALMNLGLHEKINCGIYDKVKSKKSLISLSKGFDCWHSSIRSPDQPPIQVQLNLTLQAQASRANSDEGTGGC